MASTSRLVLEQVNNDDASIVDFICSGFDTYEEEGPMEPAVIRRRSKSCSMYTEASVLGKIVTRPPMPPIPVSKDDGALSTPRHRRSGRKRQTTRDLPKVPQEDESATQTDVDDGDQQSDTFRWSGSTLVGERPADDASQWRRKFSFVGNDLEKDFHHMDLSDPRAKEYFEREYDYDVAYVPVLNDSASTNSFIGEDTLEEFGHDPTVKQWLNKTFAGKSSKKLRKPIPVFDTTRAPEAAKPIVEGSKNGKRFVIARLRTWSNAKRDGNLSTALAKAMISKPMPLKSTKALAAAAARTPSVPTVKERPESPDFDFKCCGDPAESM